MSDVKMIGKEVYDERYGGLIILMHFTGYGQRGHMYSYMDRRAWDDWEAGLCDWTELFISEMEEQAAVDGVTI